MRDAEDHCRLSPESAVELANGQFIATSDAPWLRLDLKEPIRPGSWIRIRYRSSIFADNVRPLIRFTDAANAGPVQPMNGTLFGVGEWIGYVPENTSATLISPAARPGPIDFRIERIERMSPARLFLRGTMSNPGWIAWMLRTFLKGERDEARRALKLASTSTAFEAYDRWRRRHSRTLDLDAIDRPRAEWSAAPKLRLFMSVGGSARGSLQATIRSLEAQYYSRWSLHYRVDDRCPAKEQAKIRAQLAGDPRISEIAPATDLAAVAADYSDDDFCALIAPGDVLPNYTLAVIVEAQARYPALAAIYGDEDSVSASGKLHSPILRPDWSPHFQSARPYLGRLTCVRARDLSRNGWTNAARFIDAQDEAVPTVLSGCAKETVHHVRRVLYRRAGEMPQGEGHVEAVPSARPQRNAAPAARYPDVAVIVLSRDNADCLAECIDGLIATTDYPSLQITLVDNGSTDAKSVSLLRDLERHPQIDVLARPGPFNFAALCNEAAGLTQAPVLVFLNDDVAMRDRNWLKPMVACALRPDVGIVGAKLLFPNGRIQHAGVVIGLGGIAAHAYHRQDPRQAGYLGRLQAAHEVAAVTAACIAIERKKFDAVGGFDEKNLPVDLNDIDLCLRLAEKGLATIWTPESVLIHRESETRGRTPWSSELYRAERTYFAERWRVAIRDDRYFHPDLSLFSYSPALA